MLHVLDPSMQGSDLVAPTLPAIPAPRIVRGKAAEQSGCSSSASSCDDLGGVGFQVQATDDLTPPERIGYLFTLVSGSLPAGLVLPGAVEPRGGEVAFGWVDGADDDQEPIDFTVRVVAIDLAGNQSVAQMVRVTDEGSGCTVARRPAADGGPAALALVAGALLAARRRRRRARCASPPRARAAEKPLGDQ